MYMLVLFSRIVLATYYFQSSLGDRQSIIAWGDIVGSLSRFISSDKVMANSMNGLSTVHSSVYGVLILRGAPFYYHARTGHSNCKLSYTLLYRLITITNSSQSCEGAIRQRTSYYARKTCFRHRRNQTANETKYVMEWKTILDSRRATEI